MSSMPWIKLYTDFLSDWKIGPLSDTLKLRFVQLLLVAGECDAEGYLVDSTGPVKISNIAWHLSVNAEQLTNEIEELARAGLMHFDTECSAWCMTNFSKRQGRSQSVKRNQWRLAQQKKRSVTTDKEESQPDVIHDAPMTHSSVLPLEEEEEEEKEIRGASAAPAPEVQAEKPAREEINRLRADLLRHFLVKTGLIAPKTDKTHIKATQKLWWTPLEDMLCDGGWQYAAVEEVLTLTVKRMLGDGLTIGDPNSILKTFRSVLAEKNRNGSQHHYSEVY